MTTQLTTRQQSIKKIFDLQDSLPYKGGDWKDAKAELSEALMPHEELPGITPEEYHILSDGYFCPRSMSELLGDLFKELPPVPPTVPKVEPDTFDLRYAIERTEKLLKVLKSMLATGQKPLDAYYSSEVMDLVQDFQDSEMSIEYSQYQTDVSYEGDHSLMQDMEKLTIKLELIISSPK